MSLFQDPAVRLDPFSLYARMRRESPVTYLEQPDAWAVFRYDDVRTVLSTHADFSSAIADRIPGREKDENVVFVDPPRHTELRGLVSRAFTPQMIANLEGRVTTLADELLDQVIEAGRMELIADLAYPLPIIVIAEMLGVDPEDRDAFRRWSAGIVSANNALVSPSERMDATAARQELHAYLREVIARRRAEPRADLISGLIAAEMAGARLSEQDLCSFCSVLLVAGHETTTHLLTNIVRVLLEHPESLARLRDEPALVAPALEEILRYRSPIQIMFRLIKRDVAIGDKTLTAGKMVWAFLGSANRDEARFPDADRFDITREPNHHIAFGSGIHFCLGAALSRLEGSIVLRAVLARLFDLERADDAPLEPAPGLIVHGVRSLPLRFRPGRRLGDAPQR